MKNRNMIHEPQMHLKSSQFHSVSAVLHQSSKGYLTSQIFSQSDRGSRWTAQRSGGQIQQCDDTVRHAAAASIHLPQLLPPHTVSTTTEQSHRSLKGVILIFKIQMFLRMFRGLLGTSRVLSGSQWIKSFVFKRVSFVFQGVPGLLMGVQWT